MNLIVILQKYLLSIFNIHEEELRKTLLLQLHIFLIITTLLVVKPTISSLFLSELTSTALPLGYVLTAIFAVIGSYFYNRVLEKKPLNKIIEGTLIGSIVSLILFGFAFKFNLAHGVLLYIPYVWVAIFGLLTASQFWILANLVYNIREAKRVFGFIGAGAISGGIFGGYITSLLTFFLNAEDLLFVAAFLLIFCIPIVRYIWKKEVLQLNLFQKSVRSESNSKNPFKLIQQSKLLSLIAVSIGLSVIVAKLVDYQYSDYASKLIEDPKKLAAFFGFWFSNLSIISLLIQLFVTKRVVGVFGVGKSLLWLPTGILIGSIILIVIPQLWVIVFIKLVDGGFKQSVNKAATELLSIPVPIEIKKRTKTFIDVVVDSIATGIAGFILIFFINGLNISSSYVSLIIIILISIWIYLIFQLKKEYINSFKKLFHSPELKRDKNLKLEAPIISISESVKRVFLNGSEIQILYMLEKTLEVKDELFFNDLKNLINHQSPKVRALAIENLYFLSTENLSLEIELFIHDKDQGVTTAAFRYLLKHYKKDIVQLFDYYLVSDDSTIANAALVGLSLELRNHKELQQRFNFHKVLSGVINKLDDIKDPIKKKQNTLAIIESIGNSRTKYFYSTLKSYLTDEDEEILLMALKSAANTLDQEFLDGIIEKLSNKNVRELAEIALSNYGEIIIDVLITKYKNGEIKNEDARFIPNVIAKFPIQKSIRALIILIEDSEHTIKIKAIDVLTKFKWKYPHLRIKERIIIDKIMDECELYQTTLTVFRSQVIIQQNKEEKNTSSTDELLNRQKLISLLENRMDWQLKRIFKFLGVKYPPSEIDQVLDVILNGKQEQRIHAIEFLDNILDIQLKKELIPIAESTMLDVVSEENLNKLNFKILEEKECFQILLSIKDAKIKQAVLSLIKTTKDNSFIPLIEKLLNKKESERVRKQALSTISSLSNT